MAKLKMKRFEAACLQNEAKALVEEFQKAGVLHLEKSDDERFSEMPTQSSVAVYEKNLDTVSAAIDILSKYGSVGSQGMFSGRKPVSQNEFSEFLAGVDKHMLKAYEIINTAKKIEDTSAEEVRCRTQSEALAVWKKLDVPMKFTGTSKAKAFIGTVPGEKNREDVLCALAQIVPEVGEYEVECVYSSKEISAFFVLCHISVENEVYSALRQIGFVSAQDSGIENASQYIAELENRIDNCRKVSRQYKDKLVSMLDGTDNLLMLHDYLTIKRDEYKNLSTAKMTRTSIILRGYVPERACKAVQKIADRYDCAISFEDTGEDDDVPVLLQNNKFCEPVEGITEMYALPGKHDVDP